MKCVILLAVMMCCILKGDAAPSPHAGRIRPLVNSDTWNNLMVLAKHAQEKDKDNETRLIPVMTQEKLKNKESCCIHANVLDYYNTNILLQIKHEYPRIDQVKTDLKRVDRDVKQFKPYCNENSFDDHEHIVKFKKNYKIYHELQVSHAQNKAIGEIDILFHYLYESCTTHYL